MTAGEFGDRLRPCEKVRLKKVRLHAPHVASCCPRPWSLGPFDLDGGRTGGPARQRMPRHGARSAPDFSGLYTTGRLPDVVTMNRAHSTHYTLFPDPRIPHVLHGWNDDGSPARINERIGDALIRNVTTDIRRYFMDDSSGEMIKDGNSIFIFEVAGL